MITWVTKQVAIGDADDSRAATQNNFDASLCVAIDLDICDEKNPDVRDYVHVTRHKVGLRDGPGNSSLTLAAAILLLESLVRENYRVLVHCHAGQSRSVMTVATWMAFKEYATLDDALAQIMPPRKVTIYKDSMYALAQHTLITLKTVLR